MNGFTNSQSISRFTDQLIRYYKIPFRSTKKDALNAVLNRIEQNERRKSIKRRIIHPVSIGISAAAVITLAVLFWFFTASVKVSAPSGGIATYRLPDDSRVVLHENSRLRFNQYNWKRSVRLQGKAYFEVEKGEGFQVITNLGKVEVLGTRFLVSDSKDNFSVECFEGRVKTSFREDTWILEPYTRLNGKAAITEKVHFDEEHNFPEFAKFQHNFSNQDLINVAREIESFFNVEIEIKEGFHKKFTGSVQTGSLESALQIVAESLQLNYQFTEKNKITISKQRD